MKNFCVVYNGIEKLKCLKEVNEIKINRIRKKIN